MIYRAEEGTCEDLIDLLATILERMIRYAGSIGALELEKQLLVQRHYLGLCAVEAVEKIQLYNEAIANHALALCKAMSDTAVKEARSHHHMLGKNGIEYVQEVLYDAKQFLDDGMAVIAINIVAEARRIASGKQKVPYRPSHSAALSNRKSALMAKTSNHKPSADLTTVPLEKAAEPLPIATPSAEIPILVIHQPKKAVAAPKVTAPPQPKLNTYGSTPAASRKNDVPQAGRPRQRKRPSRRALRSH